MATACAKLAALPDPVGDVVRGSTLATASNCVSGVRFGVVGIIYEGRPNVTADGRHLPQVGQRGLLRAPARR